MKKYLLLAASLVLVGCDRHEQCNREVLSKLEALKSELATELSDSARWAFANRREIDSALFQWSREKMEEAKKSEALPPETEQKVREFEVLQSQLMQKEMQARGIRLPSRVGLPEVSAPDEGYEALSNRVAAAKAQVADVVERRSRQASQYRGQFSTESLIAEYAEGRFDLVVDSSDMRMSHSAVLYRTNGEVLDITDGIIKLFREKAKP